MLLVVFGAGASFDSAPSYQVGRSADPRVEQSRPPLADGLFENRDVFAQALTQFPKCHALVPHLRHLAPTINLERTLAGYLEKAERFPDLHCQIMAVRYYLAYVIKACEADWHNVHMGITNYKSLLGEIERWRYENNESVCFVTFNYDTMLEAACADIGLHFGNHDDYITDQNYKLFKLHGSVNWGRCVEVRLEVLRNPEPMAMATELIRRAADLKPTDGWVFVKEQPPRPDYQATRLAICPAIAIPIENKATFECPIEHVKVLKQLLPQVTRMVTIGWRATENHFLELLSRDLPHMANLIVVAGSQQEALEIGRRLRPGRLDTNTAPGGFTDSILSRMIESFLWRAPSPPVWFSAP